MIYIMSDAGHPGCCPGPTRPDLVTATGGEQILPPGLPFGLAECGVCFTGTRLYLGSVSSETTLECGHSVGGHKQ